MNTRAGHFGSLPLRKGRSANLRVVVLAALVVAGLMVYVAGKVQIMRLGYQLDELEKQKQDLEQANRSLQIEASSLSDACDKAKGCPVLAGGGAVEAYEAMPIG